MHLKFVHGDTEIIKLIVVNYITRAVCNIAGWSFWFTMKRDNADGDELAKIQKTVGDGITIFDEENGEIHIKINPSDRALIKAASTYKWDVQCKDAEGEIVTLAGVDGKDLQGTVFIIPDTTHAIS